MCAQTLKLPIPVAFRDSKLHPVALLNVRDRGDWETVLDSEEPRACGFGNAASGRRGSRSDRREVDTRF